MAQWQPVRPEHAIEVMGVVIALQEPLPSLTLRKAFKTVEEAAFSGGLRSRHVLMDQLPIGPFSIQLTPNSAASASPSGYLFNAMAEETYVDGEVPRPPQVNEQVEVRANQIVYRSWRYVSWAWNFQRIRELTSGFLDIAADVVQIAQIRCEYLDRFIYDGLSAEADFASLFRSDSEVVPPHVFKQKDLWHSHTGASLSFENDIRRVLQVHMDATDGIADGNNVRSVGIMTALEDRVGLAAPEISPDMVYSTLDGMHSDLKDVLQGVIAPEMSQRIYLKG